MVRTNTLVLPGMGAGVVRIKGTSRALALSVDCNGRFVYLDPFLGAQLAVAEAARNVACAGAQPIGATNCLNFGNPEKPEVMWQFVRAVEGMGAACRALDIPITGGNVSLYNETDGRAVLPTPVLGVVGLIEDADRVAQADVPGGRRRGRAARRKSRGARRQRVPEDRSRADSWRSAGARSDARSGAAATAGRWNRSRRRSVRRTTARKADSPSRWRSAASIPDLGVAVDVAGGRSQRSRRLPMSRRCSANRRRALSCRSPRAPCRICWHGPRRPAFRRPESAPWVAIGFGSPSTVARFWTSRSPRPKAIWSSALERYFERARAIA